jgi:hypothetical protein
MSKDDINRYLVELRSNIRNIWDQFNFNAKAGWKDTVNVKALENGIAELMGKHDPCPWTSRGINWGFHAVYRVKHREALKQSKDATTTTAERKALSLKAGREESYKSRVRSIISVSLCLSLSLSLFCTCLALYI